MRVRLAVVVALALAVAGTAAAASGSKPVLRVDTKHGVRGSHFRAHELVRVVVVADVRQVRQVRAGAGGSFAALLPPPTDSCRAVLIRATGSSGDVATIR